MVFEKFDSATFEMIQDLIFPLIKTFTGFDAQNWAGDKSELFIKVGDGLGDLSALFILVGTALQDGKLTADEVSQIIAKAKTLPEAVDEIAGFFSDNETVAE